MPNLNRVTLIGHLGADPEVKQAGETTVTKFNLAVTDRWKDRNDERQEHTNWIPVSVWNGRGENLPKFIRKGSTVLVEGAIRVTQYDDDGDEKKRRYFTEVVATNIVFLDKKTTDAQQEIPSIAGRRDKHPDPDPAATARKRK